MQNVYANTNLYMDMDIFEPKKQRWYLLIMRIIPGKTLIFSCVLLTTFEANDSFSSAAQQQGYECYETIYRQVKAIDTPKILAEINRWNVRTFWIILQKIL